MRAFFARSLTALSRMMDTAGKGQRLYFCFAILNQRSSSIALAAFFRLPRLSLAGARPDADTMTRLLLGLSVFDGIEGALGTPSLSESSSSEGGNGVDGRVTIIGCRDGGDGWEGKTGTSDVKTCFRSQHGPDGATQTH
jgi:hypothetical protein